MNVPAALVIQSIPFAGMVLATRRGAEDVFAILYIVGVGLLLSLIVWWGDQAGFDQMIATVAEFE